MPNTKYIEESWFVDLKKCKAKPKLETLERFLVDAKSYCANAEGCHPFSNCHA